MATLPALTGAATPHAEGISLWPALLRDAAPLNRPRPLSFEHEGNRALRQGDWKLVAKGPQGAWELYNIAQDRAESRNLIHEKPEIARSMIAAWHSEARRTHILPWPWKKMKEE